MIRLRAAIVDDEPIARDRLRRLLSAEPCVDLVGEFASGQEMLVGLKRRKADVVFLDITMPGMDGFDALACLPSPQPLIAFVTAHSDFAVRAFNVEAADYLLKPTSGPRLRATLEKLRRAVRQSGREASNRIAVPIGGRVHLLDESGIDYVEAQENYLTIHSGSRHHTLRRTMSRMQEQLSPVQFVRVHRSYVVRIAAVADVTPLGSGRFILRLHNNASIPTGRSYCDDVRQRFHLLTKSTL